MKVFYNGKFCDDNKPIINVFDHGFLYGDGIFEGIKMVNGKVFKLKEHIDRLYSSAKFIYLNIPYTKEEMINYVIDTIKVNEFKDRCYIRLIVTRGVGDLGIDPRKCSKANVIIIVNKISLFPKELYDKGISAITTYVRKNAILSLDGRVKSLNYLNNVLAKQHANLSNADEAILLNENGYITEGSADNIFIVKDLKVYTPPSYLGILEGITRNTIIDLSKNLDLWGGERLFSLYELLNADEVFLTGTAAGVIPVVKINGIDILDGKVGEITKRLIKEYNLLEESYGYKVW